MNKRTISSVVFATLLASSGAALAQTGLRSNTDQEVRDGQRRTVIHRLQTAGGGPKRLRLFDWTLPDGLVIDGHGDFETMNPVPPERPSGGAAADGEPCGDTCITHSDSLDSPYGWACNLLFFNLGNVYARTFDLSEFGIGDHFDICGVDIGINYAFGGRNGYVPADLYLFDTTDLSDLNPGTMIGSESYEIDDQAMTLANFPIDATTTTGELTVVLVVPPELLDKFFIGFNDSGQTGPSYWAAEHCHVEDLIDLGDIGFDWVHFVMQVCGTDQDFEDCNDNGIPDECEVAPEVLNPDPPCEDECTDAWALDSFQLYYATTADSTGEDWFCGLLYGRDDCWFKYTPSYNDTVFVRVEGPPTEFIYAVYDGCPDNGGTFIDCNETDHFEIVYPGEKGHTYYIRVSAFDGGFGDFEINIVGPPALLNENDCDGNGILDECECWEDVNGDGAIDAVDLGLVLDAAGLPCDGCLEDVDRSGFVDDHDAMLVAERLGENCPF